MNGDSAGGESVPRGAGDEEAHVVQRPPGTGLRPGPLRALGRRELRLGLCLLRGAVAAAAAQLSAHGLALPEPLAYSSADLHALLGAHRRLEGLAP